jgi:carbon-monoxide dehydrogenase medium subunit
LRASTVESALAGAPRDGVAAAAEQADMGTDPPGDTFASADFRRHLSHVLTRRAVEEAMGKV